MEAEFFPPLYTPLCKTSRHGGNGRGSRIGGGIGGDIGGGGGIGGRGIGGGGLGGSGSHVRCRPNSAEREILLFYQGAHSFNGFRAQVLDEMDRLVFFAKRKDQQPCDCHAQPSCCVNRTNGVAYFYSGSHWHPTTPLGFRATIEWMQRSRFCLCPPGDVPYNKRYFTALLAGCVPVLFSFQSQVGG